MNNSGQLPPLTTSLADNIRVLIVNDSPMLTAVLQAILETDSRYQVIGSVNDGKKAVDFFQRMTADIVLMDIHMPNMGGVTATQKIIQHWPKTRILIVTATVTMNMSFIFSALNAGALDYVQTPTLPFKPGSSVSSEQLRESGARLLSKLKSLSNLELSGLERSIYTHPARSLQRAPPQRSSTSSQVIVIGCSTGGPSTLALLLGKLTDVPACPIVICQHIEPGFSGDFASWLEDEVGVPTQLAKDRCEMHAGHLYIVPAGRNLGLTVGGRFDVSTPPGGQIFTPNIDFLFSQFAEYFSERLLGIVLTGMGADGAKGAKDIIRCGGKVLTQDSRSALIDSMPKNTRKAISSHTGYMPNQLTVMMERWMHNMPIREGG